ncbi:22593_t:CDS:1 [Dentiscutata erythropus]|uniref:22593_t:CDS:1 n=1 Tax=Dentiscutata erythropus TaxID=1348616 RepID=A0A9N9JTQ1_9GLOM|nr:22593_t:CDS:1 [Dentiscutata erythropus]
MKDMREFMTTISTKPLNNVGFLVSNARLSEYAKLELENSELKERICVCFFHEIIDNIKKYAMIMCEQQQQLKKKNKERKRKMIESETETRIVRKENKRIKEDYQVHIQHLENRIIKLEKKFETQNQEMNEKLEIQNEKLDMILSRLSK